MADALSRSDQDMAFYLTPERGNALVGFRGKLRLESSRSSLRARATRLNALNNCGC